MAVRYTSNLRLRIEDDLTADAVYNLQRIDELGAVFKLSTSSTVELASAEDVLIQANNPAAGGSGIGGLISLGSASQPSDNINLYSSKISLLAGEINLGTATLTGSYTIPWERISSAGGSISTFSDFNESVATSPSVSASLSHISRVDNPHGTTAAQVGAYSTAQTDSLLSAKANLAQLLAHTEATTGVHGVTGQVVGTTDAQVLSNKYLDADANTLTNVRNSAIAPDAAILGTKIRPDFGSQTIRTSGGLRLDAGGVQYITLLPSAAQQAAPLSFRFPSSYGSVGQVLATDGQGNLSWQNAAGAAISEEQFYWFDTDGNSLTITHGFNSQSLDISIRDTADGELIYVPDINMIDNSTITLISSEVPSNAWVITIQGVAR